MTTGKALQFCLLATLAAATTACVAGRMTGSSPRGSAPPEYRVDAAWPATLPNDWILGQVAGIAVDARDHVWVVHRPRSVTADEAAAVQNPPTAECCVPAPSVIEFDPAGRVVQAWGGPTWDRGRAAWIEPAQDWPQQEHGIHVDGDGNLWLAGNGPDDHIVVKYDASGRHLLTLGIDGETGGSNDIARLGQPAAVAVDTAAREAFVADGYGNRRVIVVDADTGAYRRHFGAYGRTPDDRPLPDYTPGEAPAAQFRGPVHAVALARDGRLYVADRGANRIQQFTRDGRFEAETVIAPATLGPGAVWDIALAPGPGQPWLFVADGQNKKVWILDRASLGVAGEFGRGGRQAGEFNWVHNLAVDSRGNVYTAEVNTGKRVQKFSPAAD